MGEAIYTVALAAGLLSFVSPCIIPMISVYFTLITGLSIDELHQVEEKQLRASIFIKTVLFVLAFTIVFTLAGGAAGEVGRVFQEKMWLLNLIGGAFITLLGLNMAGWLNLPVLEKINLGRYFDLKRFTARNKYLSAFLVGLFFAVACSHCIGPTLYSVLIAAGATGSAVNGMLVMFLFSVGLAIPYLVVAFFITTALDWIKRLTPYKRFIGMTMGLLMIAFGLLMMASKFTLLTAFFSRVLPYKLPVGM